jgi:hypothetical protein
VSGVSDRVVNLKDFPKLGRNQYLLPTDVVRVDRGTPHGNPFPLPKPEGPGDRDRVIAQFARYAMVKIRQEPDWLRPLRGMRLACHCHPKKCHAQVLVELDEATDSPWEMGEVGRLQFGIDRLPPEEATAAPAWPSADDIERERDAEYRAFIRGER